MDITTTTPPAAARWRGERLLVAVTITAAAAAWLLLASVSRTAAGARLHHHGPSTSTGAVDHLLFATGWLLMVAAMMLPVSLRFVVTLRRLLGSRRHGGLLVLTGLAGYALVWVLVGELFQLADPAVHALVDTVPWLGDRQYLVTAGALALAGGYQLAPVRMRCLRACRNPAGFVAQGWHGRSPGREVFQVGTAYGWSCAGCCWALMLLMFAAGLTSLWLMAALTVVMVVERRARRVELAVPALAATLLLVAALVATRLLPPFGTS
jgi:predicted metal-binding membrane protein